MGRVQAGPGAPAPASEDAEGLPEASGFPLHLTYHQFSARARFRRGCMVFCWGGAVKSQLRVVKRCLGIWTRVPYIGGYRWDSLQ